MIMVRQKGPSSIGPVYKRITLPLKTPFFRLNFKLQAVLLATERSRRLDLFKKQKVSADKFYFNPEARYKRVYDYINLHLMNEAWFQRNQMSGLRSSGSGFLEFIDGFDFKTSKGLEQQIDQE